MIDEDKLIEQYADELAKDELDAQKGDNECTEDDLSSYYTDMLSSFAKDLRKIIADEIKG